MTTPRFERLAMMPWFARDFLASVRDLKPAEVGAYFLMLCYEWDGGPLPNNPHVLAWMAQCSSEEEFNSIWEKISHKFEVTADGRHLVNHRLEKERAESLERLAKHRRGAAKTNAQRWGTETPVGEP